MCTRYGLSGPEPRKSGPTDQVQPIRSAQANHLPPMTQQTTQSVPIKTPTPVVASVPGKHFSCPHASQAADRSIMSTTHPTHPISAAMDETVEVPIPIPTHSSRPLTSYAHVPVLCPCRRAGDYLPRQSGSAGLILLVRHINTGTFRAQVLDSAQ